MSNKYYFIVVLFLFGCYFSVSAQTEPKTMLLRGYVIGSDTNNTVPLANILKRPSGERFISNRYGAFGIQLNENDTLIFSVIGYQNLVLPLKKYVMNQLTDPIRVKLKSTSYRLKEVEVNYNQRKRDSLARQAAKILKTSPLLNNYQHVNSWVTGSSGSVITDLFAGGNRQLQQYIKLQRLVELYQEQMMVDERYTNSIILRSTNLKPDEVLEFKKFCNLPHYFILNSNDYDLVLAIRACYAEFARQKN